MRRITSTLLLLGLLGIASGCASLRPPLQAPTLAFVGAELERASVLEQRLRVRMRVTNPNDREIAVRGVTYTLEVAGEELGRGVSGNAFTIPAVGTTNFEVLVTANLAPVVLKLATRLGRDATIPYRIRGEVTLASGLLRKIPFDETGALRLR